MQLSDKYQSSRNSLEIAQRAQDNAEQNYKELEKRFDHYVTQGVEEKTPELQQQIEAKLSADFQAKIDSQNDEISRLKNQINTSSDTPAQIAILNQQLAELEAKKAEAEASLSKITIEFEDQNAAKQANHAYKGTAMALAHDVYQHYKTFESLSSAFVDDSEDDNLYPLYDLTFDTKDYLLEVVKVLRNTAKSIEFLAKYNDQAEQPKELDAIDEAFQSLGSFFLKWKEFRHNNTFAGNNYDWWFSRLREEKSTKLKKHLSNFEQIWERYQFEIQAIN